MAWRCEARRLHREPTNYSSQAEHCGHTLAPSRFHHSWLAAQGLPQSLIWMLWNDLQYPCQVVREAARHRSSGRAAMRARGFARRVCCARVLRRRCSRTWVGLDRGAFLLADSALGEPQIHAVLKSQEHAQHWGQDSPFSRDHPVPGTSLAGLNTLHRLCILSSSQLKLVLPIRKAPFLGCPGLPIQLPSPARKRGPSLLSITTALSLSSHLLSPTEEARMAVLRVS